MGFALDTGALASKVDNTSSNSFFSDLVSQAANAIIETSPAELALEGPIAPVVHAFSKQEAEKAPSFKAPDLSNLALGIMNAIRETSPLELALEGPMAPVVHAFSKQEAEKAPSFTAPDLSNLALGIMNAIRETSPLELALEGPMAPVLHAFSKQGTEKPALTAPNLTDLASQLAVGLVGPIGANIALATQLNNAIGPAAALPTDHLVAESPNSLNQAENIESNLTNPASQITGLLGEAREEIAGNLTAMGLHPEAFFQGNFTDLAEATALGASLQVSRIGIMSAIVRENYYQQPVKIKVSEVINNRTLTVKEKAKRAVEIRNEYLQSSRQKLEKIAPVIEEISKYKKLDGPRYEDLVKKGYSDELIALKAMKFNAAFNRAAKAFGHAGKLGLVLDGAKVLHDAMYSKDKTQVLTRAALNYGMAEAGGYAGAAIGGLLGGPVGAVIGYGLGTIGGGALGDKIGNVIFGAAEDKHSEQQTQDRQAVIPTGHGTGRKDSWQKTENTIYLDWGFKNGLRQPRLG
ncbi:MAG: hypothetical protein WDW19_03875 [Neisseriaceae bacterium]